MTMNFRTIKDNIVSILGAAEAGRYQTVGFQRQGKGADEVIDSLRMVQVYFSEGEFSKRGGRITGPTQHDVTYRIDLTVSKAAEGDLSTINNPSSTAPQVAAALLAFGEASNLADQSIDELYDIIYQVIMDALNYDLDAAVGVVSDRWINRLQKDEPLPRGELVVITGSANLTCRMSEAVTGDTGTAGATFDTVIDIDGDDVEQTGVAGTLGG